MFWGFAVWADRFWASDFWEGDLESEPIGGGIITLRIRRDTREDDDEVMAVLMAWLTVQGA